LFETKYARENRYTLDFRKAQIKSCIKIFQERQAAWTAVSTY